MKKTVRVGALSLLLAALMLPACSSSYKTQGYARTSNSKEFEEEYPVVWKAVKEALGDYKVESEDEEDGEIQTDWIYSTSNDKYLEYTVNGFPRKKYLQNRYKLKLEVKKQYGSVKVNVLPKEEIEVLKGDGTPDGWKSVSEPESVRADELLKSIEMKILSRHN